MRVLVADDHALFRDGIVSLLEAAGHSVVGQAGDGQSALAAVLQLQPDLVLLDLNMPEAGGIEALRAVKEALPETRVVMLTISDDDRDLLEAVKAGADGYLLKSLTTEEFLDMLRAVERGEAAMTRQMTAILMRGLAETAGQTDTPVESLTPREIELLQLVADGLPNKAIAQALDVSENTVKYHMKSILQKLNAQNRTEAVMQAMRSGIITSR